MSFEWIIKEPEKDVADAEDDSLAAEQSRAVQSGDRGEERERRISIFFSF